ncbi:MAG TPA: TldD/PmbA family protein [Oscillatoriales cyanobacterium M59_W2019_021]|nr:TldD/PmbA family protein [Oscillatoriales cyanobacterium M4454_W2019_049]HIK53240.1 TldD/PmbA family protein [Oscillatoriales cyanobacterium M59_W2019_021]
MTNDFHIEQLLELALKSGAEAAEVFQSRSHSRPVSFEANRLKQLDSVESEGVALRVWTAGRPGLAVAYGAVDFQALVDRAIAISQLNPPEEIELNDSRVEVYPDTGSAVEIDRLIEWGKTAIALLQDAYPEIICHAEWEYDVESTRLINSRGLDCSHTDTTLSCYVETEWIRGDDFLAVSDGQTRRTALDPHHLAQQILQRLDWAKENVPPPIGRVPILFTAKAADLLWGTVQAALNGKQAIERASPWSDRLGERVVSPRLTLSQHPNKGPYSCPFDDEGTPTRPTVFVREGILQLFYTDLAIGRRLGSGTTGNGFRPGLDSYPSPGAYNFIVQPGDGTLEEAIALLDKGSIVDEILGHGSGISGEFSINVALGYAVENGEVTGRIKDTMVSGNVYTALKEVAHLAGDAEWNGSCYTPSAIVEGLSVTGRC